jgi:nucleotide-binding universal stress UspA family protein
MFRHILVPTDGSDTSAAAEAAAIALARVAGAEIVALSVGQPYPSFPAAEAAMVVDPAAETKALQAWTAANVGRVAQAAAAAGVACTTVTAIDPSPSRVILAQAGQRGCDLIFMASHGRRGLSRLLAGSETQAVLAQATVPVLVLRPQPGAGSGARPDLATSTFGTAAGHGPPDV